MSRKKHTQPDKPAGELDSSGNASVRAHGGKRPGAGRPPGAKNALPQGAVLALKSLNLRVPKDAHPAAADAANRALERIMDVMEERVGSFHSFPVLTAARAIREEVCGPLKQKVEHTGEDGEPISITINRTVKGGEG